MPENLVATMPPNQPSTMSELLTPPLTCSCTVCDASCSRLQFQVCMTAAVAGDAHVHSMVPSTVAATLSSIKAAPELLVPDGSSVTTL